MNDSYGDAGWEDEDDLPGCLGWPVGLVLAAMVAAGVVTLIWQVVRWTLR